MAYGLQQGHDCTALQVQILKALWICSAVPCPGEVLPWAELLR